LKKTDSVLRKQKASKENIDEIPPIHIQFLFKILLPKYVNHSYISVSLLFNAPTMCASMFSSHLSQKFKQKVKKNFKMIPLQFSLLPIMTKK